MEAANVAAKVLSIRPVFSSAAFFSHPLFRLLDPVFLLLPPLRGPPWYSLAHLSCELPQWDQLG